MMKATRHFIESLYASIQRLTVRVSRIPVVGILARAALKDQKNMSKDMAASTAYFTFLSLFPMILGLFAIGGLLLKSEAAQARLSSFVADLLPTTSDFVMRNIESLVQMRGAVGMFSILVLMWSASKMVAAISRGINYALGFKRPYSRYLSPLRNFGLTLSVSVLVFMTIAIAPIIGVLDELELGIFSARWNAFFGLVSGYATGFAVSAFLLSAMYLLIPYQRLTLRELAPGILTATVVIELGKGMFSYYVTNVSPYDAVYGSISSMIALLIWLYFSARVLLYGTELIAVLRESSNQQAGGESHPKDVETSQ